MNSYRRKSWIENNFPTISIRDYTQGLILNDSILISPNQNHFKLLSLLDWAYFTKIGILCKHLIDGTIEEYYESQLPHPKSHPNIWTDKKKEKKLKRHYSNKNIFYKFQEICGNNKFHILNEDDTYCDMSKTRVTNMCYPFCEKTYKNDETTGKISFIEYRTIITNEDEEYIDDKDLKFLKRNNIPTDSICKRCRKLHMEKR